VAPASLGDPTRADHPVGTGPFVLKEWVRGDHFLAVRNPHYWRAGLPLLDSIEYRPILDPQARESSFRAGVVGMLQTVDTQTIVDLRSTRAGQLFEQSRGRVEVGFVSLNTARPPLDDLRVRQALALALDRGKFNQLINNGIVKDATGPFSDGSGYLDAPGYPAFDLAKASALVSAYESDHGLSRVDLELDTPAGGKNAAAAELIAGMWRQAGLTVKVVAGDQATLSANALTGNYLAAMSRQFGEPDPDVDTVWWSSSTAAPFRQPGLNYARNHDTAIDRDLTAARTTADAGQRRTAFEDITAQLNKDLPYLWTAQVIWAVAASPRVHGVDTPTLPDGKPALALCSGLFHVAELGTGS
jgi:ABC-type transport system substrate-binding protein